MRKYDIVKVELSNIKYIDYPGNILHPFYGEIDPNELPKLISTFEKINEEFLIDKIRPEICTMMPRYYINAMRELDRARNASIAFLIYKEIRSSLIYPKKDISKDTIDNKSISDFIDSIEGVIPIREITRNGNTNILKLEIITDRYEIDSMTMDIEKVVIKYDSGLLGYTKSGNLYILSYENETEDNPILISFNKVDGITFLESTNLEDLLTDPIKSHSVMVLNKPKDTHHRNHFYLCDFIEAVILKKNINRIFLQSLIPYRLKNIMSINRQYRREKDFIIDNKIDRFEILLRAISIVFKLNTFHSTIRVTPYRKLFNMMDRIDRRETTSKKKNKKDYSPFEYITQNNQTWESESFQFIDDVTGECLKISRKNNDMIVMLLFLYDEGVLESTPKTLLGHNMRSFRKRDNIIDRYNFDDEYTTPKKHAKERLEICDYEMRFDF